MRLYDISTDFAAILAEIEAADGEVEGDLEARLDATGVALAEKVDACAVMLRTLEAGAEAVRAEEQRLAARRKTLEASAERLEKYMGACLRIAGQKKIVGTRFTVSLQANPPAVKLLVPENEVPSDYVTTKTITSVDKKAIKAALDSGAALDFAELVRGESVRVR